MPSKRRKPSTFPELEDLALFLGTDRWAKLESQASIVRGWNLERFHDEVRTQLDLHLVTHEAAQAVKLTARHLLIACGSSPQPSDT